MSTTALISVHVPRTSFVNKTVYWGWASSFHSAVNLQCVEKKVMSPNKASGALVAFRVSMKPVLEGANKVP